MAYQDLIQIAPFLKEADKKKLVELIEEIKTFEQNKNIDNLMRRWMRVSEEVAWYAADASRILHAAETAKERCTNPKLSQYRELGYQQWAAHAKISMEPDYQQCDEEVALIKAWHDYISRLYTIVMTLPRMLEQLSNNQRLQIKQLDT